MSILIFLFKFIINKTVCLASCFVRLLLAEGELGGGDLLLLHPNDELPLQGGAHRVQPRCFSVPTVSKRQCLT